MPDSHALTLVVPRALVSVLDTGPCSFPCRLSVVKSPLKWVQLLIVTVVLAIASILHTSITVFYRFFPFPGLLGEFLAFSPLPICLAFRSILAVL